MSPVPLAPLAKRSSAGSGSGSLSGAVRRQPPQRHPAGELRVSKRLHAGQAGTQKLSALYGERLVCVRYRIDDARDHRYTTVEIVVAEGPTSPQSQRAKRSREWWLRLPPNDQALRRQVLQHGGCWNPEHRLWTLHRDVVIRLNLQCHVVHPPENR
jgi:hypothetical protein